MQHASTCVNNVCNCMQNDLKSKPQNRPRDLAVARFINSYTYDDLSRGGIGSEGPNFRSERMGRNGTEVATTLRRAYNRPANSLFSICISHSGGFSNHPPDTSESIPRGCPKRKPSMMFRTRICDNDHYRQSGTYLNTIAST